jgi:Fur family ferric uptake transcriptional regulator
MANKTNGIDVRTLFRKHGVVCTQQRLHIARTLLSEGKHIDAEQLHAIVNRRHGSVALATVYRTVQLLKEKGLIDVRRFGGRLSRYEKTDQPHHDHLVCMSCGRVIEFTEPAIEQLQERVTQKHRFEAINHHLELYGYCQTCCNGN